MLESYFLVIIAKDIMNLVQYICPVCPSIHHKHTCLLYVPCADWHIVLTVWSVHFLELLPFLILNEYKFYSFHMRITRYIKVQVNILFVNTSYMSYKIPFYIISPNCISGLIVSVLASRTVDRGFELRSSQTKEY